MKMTDKAFEAIVKVMQHYEFGLKNTMQLSQQDTQCWNAPSKRLTFLKSSPMGRDNKT